MRITGLEAWPVDLDLAQPYAVAYESYEVAENVLVRLKTDGPLTGLGLAAPDSAVTGESRDSTLAELIGTAAPALKGLDPFRPEAVMAALNQAGLAESPSARAAVDLALHDLLGLKASLPLWRLLGGFRSSIPTSVTIGICPKEETLSQARAWLAQGFSILKIKGGLDPEEDAARLKAVKELAPEVGLRFDANQGYGLDEARRFLELSAPLGLELVEQPCAADRPELMGRLKGLGSPIMADESLLDERDALKIAVHNWAEMINIKLMKTGGLLGAARLEAVAVAAGQGVMVGCMDEAALGISGGLALALAKPGVIMADLDGHLELIDDPTAAALKLDRGRLWPSPHPGLGLPPEVHAGLEA